MDFIERQEEKLGIWLNNQQRNQAEDLKVLRGIQRATVIGPIMGALLGGILAAVVTYYATITLGTAPSLPQTNHQTSTVNPSPSP